MAKSNAGASARPTKRYPTIAPCGLDCGLCPRYYTAGPSRCPGCAGPGFFEKHPGCSFITCCVRDRKLEACGECADFPCAKFKAAEEYERIEEQHSSLGYPSSRRVLPNLCFIREHGIDEFVRRQAERIRMLELMLNEFDDGRSKSFYCKAAGTYEVEALRTAIAEARRAVEAERIGPADRKTRAAALRKLIQELPRPA